MAKNKHKDQKHKDNTDDLKVDPSLFGADTAEDTPESEEATSIHDEELVESVEGGGDQSADPLKLVNSLRKQVHDLEVEVQDNKNKVLYHMAECQNVRERAGRDVENAHRYGTEKLLRELLPVLDSLERGMEECQSDDAMVKSLHHGMELTHSMFLKALSKFNVEQVSPMGEAFNAEIHEAISVKENKTVKANTVIEVLQKGYLLNERLVRPALVVVAK